MSRSLRVVTINTGKGDGPYSKRLALLGSGLQRLQPDIVLLQECLSVYHDPRDTLQALAETLGMRARYAPARRKYRMVEGEFVLSSSGLGILTRHPIVDTDVLALPEDPEDGERIAQLAILEWNAGQVLLANLHLSPLRERSDLRRRQIATLVAHPWFQRDGSMWLVGGDLNTPVEDLPDLFKGLDGWIWRDGYIEGGGADERATVPVYMPPKDGRCIDYILSVVRGPASPHRFQDAAVVLQEPENGIFPSDHRGMMVTLSIDGTKT